MAPSVSLDPSTFSRLQALAVPLVDTIDTVVNRALDALEASKTTAALEPMDGPRSFNPAAPPNLSFTTVRSVKLGSHRFPPKETYWNSLMVECIREAAKQGKSSDEINDLILVPSIVGKKEESGYKFIQEAGVSVQGQDANAAWRAIFRLATALNLTVEVSFVWQANPKAAFPGDLGLLATPKG
ncbi:T4SS efffector SepA family protein [Methylobacterium trifolii]|uniref:T4SS efffector SepA family protein n=1 Tax=Methylobacterium trifolii TaxID=1003092 RepID=UPI001EDD48C1|nr:hypothetical protein [Methylobacterium trifolii]